MTDIPGLPYDGVTDIFDESGNGKGVALNVWPADNRIPLAHDPIPLDTFVLAMGEMAYAIDSQRLRVGDGYTAGGDELAYLSDIVSIELDIDNINTALDGKANLDGGNSFTGNQSHTGSVTAPVLFALGAGTTAGSLAIANADYSRGVEMTITATEFYWYSTHPYSFQLDAGEVLRIAPGVVTVKNDLSVVEKITAKKVDLAGAVGCPLTINQGNQTNVPALLINNNGIGYTGIQFNNVGGGQYRVGSKGGPTAQSNEHYSENREMYFWTNGGAFDAAPTSFQFQTTSGPAKNVMSLKNGNAAFSGDFLRGLSSADVVQFRIKSDGLIETKDDPYTALWDNNLEVPTKNAIYDKIQGLGAGAGIVSDEAYGGTWNGVTAVAPSKNAVYDQIQALVLGSGSFLPLTGGQLTGGLHVYSTVPQLVLRASAGNPTLRFRDAADSNTLADFFVTSGSVSLKAGVTGLQIMNAAGSTTYYQFAQAGMTVNVPASITGTLAVSGAITQGGVGVSLVGHTHVIADVTGLQGALDAKAPSTSLANYVAKTGDTMTGNLIVQGSSQSKASVPATNGWVGLTPGNATSAGYIEFYGPDQVRAGYFGFGNAVQMDLTVEGGRKLTMRAQGFKWERTGDGAELANLDTVGKFEAPQLVGVMSTGTYAGANITQCLEVRSANSATYGSWMAFHAPGSRAMHVGLDIDNVFKIGGWGWGYTKPQLALTDAGILLLSGAAIAMQNAAQCEIQFGVGASHGIHYMSATNSGFYKGGGNHFYVEMAAGGTMHHSGPMRSESKMVFRNSNPAFNSAEIFIGSGAPTGGNDGDVWLQYI